MHDEWTLYLSSVSSAWWCSLWPPRRWWPGRWRRAVGGALWPPGVPPSGSPPSHWSVGPFLSCRSKANHRLQKMLNSHHRGAGRNRQTVWGVVFLVFQLIACECFTSDQLNVNDQEILTNLINTPCTELMNTYCRFDATGLVLKAIFYRSYSTG